MKPANDGLIYINHMKNAFTIEVELRELVTCQHCKHYFPDDNGHVVTYRCELLHSDMRSDFFCADGERAGA